MKKLVFLLSFFFFTSSFAQVKVLKPTEIIPIPEIDLFKCEQLFLTDDVRYEDMSPEDKALVDLGERDRVLEHFYSAACSWYCGGIVSEVTSSSALSAKYAGENAHDFSILNAWAEGVPGGGVGEYLLYTFIVAFVFCTMVALIQGQKFTAPDILFGCLVGIPNYFSARFLLLSLSSVPAVIAYPVFSIGTIILTGVAGVIWFHEKITARQWAALAISYLPEPQV